MGSHHVIVRQSFVPRRIYVFPRHPATSSVDTFSYTLVFSTHRGGCFSYGLDRSSTCRVCARRTCKHRVVSTTSTSNQPPRRWICFFSPTLRFLFLFFYFFLGRFLFVRSQPLDGWDEGLEGGVWCQGGDDGKTPAMGKQQAPFRSHPMHAIDGISCKKRDSRAHWNRKEWRLCHGISRIQFQWTLEEKGTKAKWRGGGRDIAVNVICSTSTSKGIQREKNERLLLCSMHEFGRDHKSTTNGSLEKHALEFDTLIVTSLLSM